MTGADSNAKFVWPPRDAAEHSGDPVQQTASCAAMRRWVPERSSDRGSVVLGDALRFAAFGSAPHADRASVRALRAIAASDVCARCAGPVGPGEVDGAGCAWCRPRRLGFGEAVSLGLYDRDLRDAVHALKYHADRACGWELGRALGGSILDRIGSMGEERGRFTIVPVPTTVRRRMSRNRGIDHTLTLARGAASVSGIPVARALRRSHGPSQTGVAASARAANVRGRFRVAPAFEDRTLDRVILIDDVRTTGATLTACARALAPCLGCGGTTGGRGVLRAVAGRVLGATVAVSAEGRRGLRGGNAVGPGEVVEKSKEVRPSA